MNYTVMPEQNDLRHKGRSVESFLEKDTRTPTAVRNVLIRKLSGSGKKIDQFQVASVLQRTCLIVHTEFAVHLKNNFSLSM